MSGYPIISFQQIVVFVLNLTITYAVMKGIFIHKSNGNTKETIKFAYIKNSSIRTMTFACV